MTYTDTSPNFSPNFRSLRKDPLVWAAAISLGLHGLLWVLAPLFPQHERFTEEEVQRPVDLTELSAVERQRLPSFLNDEVTLPEIAQQPDLGPQNFSLTPLPNQSPISLSPPLPPFFVPPPPPALPPSAYRLSPQSLRPPRIALDTPPDSSPATSPQPSTSPSPAATPSASDSPNPAATPSGEPPSPAASPSSSPGAASLGSPSAEARPEIPPRLATVIREQREQPDLFDRNETGTSNNDARQAYVGWFDEAVAWMGDDYRPEDYAPDTAPHKTLEPAYPEEACVQNIQGTAVVGVLVGPDGTVAEDSEPFLIRSSGYGFLNQLALDYAQAEEFEPANKKQAYRVEVKFTPDEEVCQTYLEGLRSPQPPEPAAEAN